MLRILNKGELVMSSAELLRRAEMMKLVGEEIVNITFGENLVEVTYVTSQGRIVYRYLTVDGGAIFEY